MIAKMVLSAYIRTWWHCFWHIFLLDFKHKGCSLTTNNSEMFYLKIYCKCGKIFGECKIRKGY